MASVESAGVCPRCGAGVLVIVASTASFYSLRCFACDYTESRPQHVRVPASAKKAQG